MYKKCYCCWETTDNTIHSRCTYSSVRLLQPSRSRQVMLEQFSAKHLSVNRKTQHRTTSVHTLLQYRKYYFAHKSRAITVASFIINCSQHEHKRGSLFRAGFGTTKQLSNYMDIRIPLCIFPLLLHRKAKAEIWSIMHTTGYLL